LSTSSSTSTAPRERHKTCIQFMDDQERPAAFAHTGELPNRPPKTGKPYTKEEVLAYWNICDGATDAAVDATIFRR